MPFIGSSSTSRDERTFNSTNNAQDNRQAADNGSFTTRGENITINQTADGFIDLGEAYADVANEIADQGFGYGRAVADEVFNYGRAVSSDSTDLSRAALDGGFGFGNDAFDFAADRAADAFNFGDDVLAYSEDRGDAAFELAAKALDQIDASQDEAFGFAGQGLAEVSGALTSTLNASQEDSTQITSQLLRLGIPFAALVLIVWGFNK